MHENFLYQTRESQRESIELRRKSGQLELTDLDDDLNKKKPITQKMKQAFKKSPMYVDVDRTSQGVGSQREGKSGGETEIVIEAAKTESEGGNEKVNEKEKEKMKEKEKKERKEGSEKAKAKESEGGNGESENGKSNHTEIDKLAEEESAKKGLPFPSEVLLLCGRAFKIVTRCDACRIWILSHIFSKIFSSSIPM